MVQFWPSFVSSWNIDVLMLSLVIVYFVQAALRISVSRRLEQLREDFNREHQQQQVEPHDQ
jgi:hypothetical protein